jgi:hypothetical protein
MYVSIQHLYASWNFSRAIGHNRLRRAFPGTQCHELNYAGAHGKADAEKAASPGERGRRAANFQTAAGERPAPAYEQGSSSRRFHFKAHLLDITSVAPRAGQAQPLLHSETWIERKIRLVTRRTGRGKLSVWRREQEIHFRAAQRILKAESTPDCCQHSP